jgi:hypothetical protein
MKAQKLRLSKIPRRPFVVDDRYERRGMSFWREDSKVSAGCGLVFVAVAVVLLVMCGSIVFQSFLW